MFDHLLCEIVVEWTRQRACGDDVIDRGKRSARHSNLEPRLPEHREGLDAGHFVNEVEADQELRLARRERSDGVSLPYLVQQGFHGFASQDCQTILAGNIFGRKPSRSATLANE
jgi:hypothetical protein